MHFLGSAKTEPTRTKHSKSNGKEADAPQKKGKQKMTEKRAGGRKKGEYSSKCNNTPQEKGYMQMEKMGNARNQMEQGID